MTAESSQSQTSMSLRRQRQAMAARPNRAMLRPMIDVFVESIRCNARPSPPSPMSRYWPLAPPKTQNQKRRGPNIKAHAITGTAAPTPSSVRCDQRVARFRQAIHASGSSVVAAVCFIIVAAPIASPDPNGRLRSASTIAASTSGIMKTSNSALCASPGVTVTEARAARTPATRPPRSPSRRRANTHTSVAVAPCASIPAIRGIHS